MIFQSNADLVITYSWSDNNHGICGHTFEVIDYYLLLSKHMSVEILLAEDITIETFKKAIVSKYKLSDRTLKKMLDDTTVQNRPQLLKGNKILFTDGGMMITHYTLLFEEVFIFGCGDKRIIELCFKYNVLLDWRVYGEFGINYVKKVDLKSLRKPSKSDNKTLLYLTSNCRSISPELLERLNIYHDLFIVSNVDIDGYDVYTPPVENIFEKFSKYVYTPINRKFDCSPRFIAECDYFGKTIVYEVAYLDLGLEFRKKDIKEGIVQLEDDDPIINIIKGI